MHKATRKLQQAAALSALVCGAAACSPSLNWRELRPEGTGLIVMFPCKPSVYARQMTLAGSPVTLTLRACSADGSTWALAHAALADPSSVRPALRALVAAAADNIGAPPGAAQIWAPPGATPNADAARWRLVGRLPDGTRTESQVAVFARGLSVLQATVVGPQIADDAAEMFFAGLRVQP